MYKRLLVLPFELTMIAAAASALAILVEVIPSLVFRQGELNVSNV
jgi:hypothetical protein